MPQRLRILTWNVGEPPATVLPTIADRLSASNADLVFFNEIMSDSLWNGWSGAFGPNQAQELARQCGYRWVHFADNGVMGHGGIKYVALLSRHRLSNPAVQPALKDPNFGGNYFALEVQAVIDGRRWYCYTLRFSSHHEPHFRRHCELLRDRILSLPPGTPVIAAGDFNGGAHLDARWRNSPAPRDDTLLLRINPALQDLLLRTGLQSATSGLAPMEDKVFHTNPEKFSPPYIRATDLILYRGPVERISVSEGHDNIGAEAHQWLFTELGPPGSRLAQAPGALPAIASLLEPEPPVMVKPRRRPRRRIVR